MAPARKGPLVTSEPEPHTDSQRREYHERFTQTVSRWLDAGYGRCILARPDCRAVMEASLLHFDGVRYDLGEFVVMPNHVHAIVAPIGEHKLSQILHTWKSFTAHQFSRVLTLGGSIWHRESFDHIVRSAEHLAKFDAYIRNNPEEVVSKARMLRILGEQSETLRLLVAKRGRFAYQQEQSEDASLTEPL